MKTKITLLLSIAFLINLKAQEMKFEGAKALEIRQKTTCNTLEEGKPVYGMWEGRIYSRVQGEKDRHLFNIVGINVRQCDCVDDPVRGKGFRSVGREIMMYLDPVTNEIIDKWKNPWTGETVDVIHVANDPVNMRGYVYEKDEEGNVTAKTSFRKYGDVAVTSYEVPLFYNNPLSGDYQKYIGGTYHAMEIFNTYYKAEELTNSKIKNLSQSNISWQRMSQWLPWMKMGSRPGWIIANATGESILEKSEVWPRIQKILDERYPLYNTPPVIDDKRPNETSWTVFKKYLANKKKEEESKKE
ncbi:DUF1838 family protein [uncultured Maribacter sp.]|uniref:DUF1838 family protein n=1 Tax=uncultured Maribacter sp. TaxID=431308 RepID=UPI002636266E|nr:DUF1838 family protein [uncultured Maribacter sp.]